MKIFDLSIYKETKTLFYIFDAYIKEQKISKELFLQENGITPSSYRKCRKGELNIGKELINKLSNCFNFKQESDDFIDELEEFVNKVYYSMYYKNYNSYDDDLNYLNNLLDKNYLLFPILKLLKLYLLISSNKNISNVKNETLKLYNDIKNYADFYEFGLKKMYEIIYIALEKELSPSDLTKKYHDGSIYFVLASRCFEKKKYIEALYYAKLSKDILLEDGNFNRILYLNYTIMASLRYLHNYQDSYEMAFKQLRSLYSINCKESFHFNACNNNIAVCLLALKRYDDIIKTIYQKESVTLIEVLCILISLYVTCKHDLYDDYLHDLSVDELPDKYYICIKTIDSFLKREKTALKEINNLKIYDSVDSIVEILKNIENDI